MTLTIKEGGYYRTRDGRKVGPMSEGTTREWPWECEAISRLDMGSRNAWRKDGSFRPLSREPSPFDLVAEWSDTPLPVRKVTRTEIVPGDYGIVGVGAGGDGALIRVGIIGYSIAYRATNAAELRAASAVFLSLAEALEEQP